MHQNSNSGMEQELFMISVSLNAEITGEDIDDIMCTALEGGICYWCGTAEVVGEYRGAYAHEQISRGGTLRLYDIESAETHELNRDKFLLGLRLFIERGHGDLVNLKNNRIDPADFDAECADMVVQYAVFGEIVYS